MKTVSVKKIGVGSFGKVVGFYQAILGVIVGLVATIGTAVDVFNANQSLVKSTGISLFVLGFGVLIFPIFMFVIGWVQGVVAAWFLNIIFGESQGLQLEIEEQK